MRATLTQKYVETVLEEANVLKGNKLNFKRINEIWEIKGKKEREEFIGNLLRIHSYHYKKNINSIPKLLESGSKLTALSYEPYPVLHPGSYLKRVALFYDKMLLMDPLDLSLHGYTDLPGGIISQYISLKPWIEMGLVELVPSPNYWNESVIILSHIVKTDMKESQIIYSEFKKEYEKHFKGAFEEYFSDRDSTDVTVGILSSLIGEAVIGSNFLGGCHPIFFNERTGLYLNVWLRHWGDLAYRSRLLREKVTEELKAGIAFLTLETNLAFLEDLSVKKIGELRSSDEYRFKDFRKRWSEVCKDLKRMPYEAGFKDEAKQLWEERILPERNRVWRDLAMVKTRFGIKVGLRTLNILLTLASGLTFHSLLIAILHIMETKEDYDKVVEKLKQIKTDEKNAAYFLLAAEEKSVNYWRI